MEVEQGAPEDGSRPSAARDVSDRITVALIEKARGDLARLQDRTGLSKTDAVNRAIALYAYIDAEMAAGNELQVRDPETDRIQVLRLL